MMAVFLRKIPRLLFTLRLSVETAQNILDFAPAAKAESGPDI
jgi:hypothetical protein